MAEYTLDHQRGIAVLDDQQLVGPWRWTSRTRAGSMYMSLTVLAGETAVSDVLVVGHDAVVRVVVDQGVEQISADGLVAEVLFLPDGDGPVEVLGRIPMAPGSVNEREVDLGLDHLESRRGRIGVRCNPGPRNDPSGDWLAVFELVVARRDRGGLLRARSHRSWRIQHEIAHFADVYDHDIYAERAAGNPGPATVAAASAGTEAESALPPAVPPSTVDADWLAARLDPGTVGSNVYSFGHRLLQELIGRELPRWPDRLRQKGAAGGSVRMLSICSGAAGVERNILRAAQTPAQVTLFDVNEQLTEQATRSLSGLADVRAVLGDVNELDAVEVGGPFDVIVSVSALHHVVELERVLAAAAGLLAPGGELWLVGEQIGRDGGRLWPESLEAANTAFRALPPALRRNCYTGQVDELLPDRDAAASCFEGIRSSEIEPVLARYFEPVHEYRRNCFLWRMLDPGYYANYDMSREDHRHAVLGLVAAEYGHWRAGGRPTESHSVYRSRWPG